MKKYELKKCSAEFAWKERKEIKEKHPREHEIN